MSYVVVVSLSVLWLGFFVPSLLHARRASSPLASAETFRNCLATLADRPGQPRAQRDPARSPRSTSPVARRRQVLASLAFAVAIAASAGALAGGAMWLVVTPPLLALVGYVALLRKQAVHRLHRAGATVPTGTGPATAAASRTVEPVEPVDPVDVIPSVGRRSDAPQHLERIAG